MSKHEQLEKSCLICKYCSIENKHGKPKFFCELLSKNEYFYIPTSGSIPTKCPIKKRTLTKLKKELQKRIKRKEAQNE